MMQEMSVGVAQDNHIRSTHPSKFSLATPAIAPFRALPTGQLPPSRLDHPHAAVATMRQKISMQITGQSAIMAIKPMNIGRSLVSISIPLRELAERLSSTLRLSLRSTRNRL